MNNQEKIAQLKSLIQDKKSFLVGDIEHDEIYLKDIEALEFAVDEIEKVKRLG